ncbi:hypothetical protein KDI_13950 [Dictyobacter arantiisoli]|uniref:phospholipase D n=1 Tax=Dictyobacter arantiisoli TaxID=2014874 RepID=A0A5A5T8M7_9CHLR|nr:hypothetical protein KDI_13950 [Dictyobacter arantiisoli]
MIISALAGAKKSVWLEMYLLTDKKIIQALEDAAQRQIDVRVMLEDHPYGSGSVAPNQTLDRLRAAGVTTQTTNPQFALTHEKGMVIDHHSAYIMTSNFTLSALGSSRTLQNREYGIIDNNSADVQDVESIFLADWGRTQVTFSSTHLVVSPVNSRSTFLALIQTAKQSLMIEAEEMQDNSIEQALVNAKKRGIQVQVILPSNNNSPTDNNSAGITEIKQGGIQIKEDTQLYMHAKIIIVDQQKAFVGSENISTASLTANRELGIVISDATALNALQQTFQQDWSVSQQT